jgi:hypothetical protein
MWQKSLYYSLDSVKCVIALVSGGYLSSVVCQEEFNIAMYRCHQTVSIMIYYLLFYVPLKTISLIYGDVTISGEGLQNLGLCSALRAFEQGGNFIVPHLL